MDGLTNRRKVWTRDDRRARRGSNAVDRARQGVLANVDAERGDHADGMSGTEIQPSTTFSR